VSIFFRQHDPIVTPHPWDAASSVPIDGTVGLG
jgi:hypothetical protein